MINQEKFFNYFNPNTLWYTKSAAQFNQTALDQVARQGYANPRFEINSEEGLDVVEEFYMDINSKEESDLKARAKSKPKFNQGEEFVQDIQQDLQGSTRMVNY